MNSLPNDIKYNILELCENKNMIFIDKSFFNYIQKERNIFYKNIIENPIEIKYKLIRWKKKYSEEHNYRPSMYFEKEDNIFILDKDNIGLNIGTIENDIINYSKDFEDEVVPLSFMKEDNISTFSGYVIYWTVNQVWVDNIKVLKKYNLLNFSTIH